MCRASKQVANAGGRLRRTCDVPLPCNNDIGFIDLLQRWLDLLPIARRVLGRLQFTHGAYEQGEAQPRLQLAKLLPDRTADDVKSATDWGLSTRLGGIGARWVPVRSRREKMRTWASLTAIGAFWKKFRNKIWIFGFELNDPIQATM